MAQERRVLLANGQYITIVQTTGTSSGDVMSQSAVTAALSTKANVSHTHAATDITSGTFSSARIADGAITTAKLQDKSVTLAKLGSDVSLPSMSYETVTVSGLTPNGIAAIGAEVVIGGVACKFDRTGVVSVLIPYGQIYKIKAYSSNVWLVDYEATFTANTSSRSVSITYTASQSVFIEATDGMLYSSSDWEKGKKANSIVFLTDSAMFRMAVYQSSYKYSISRNSYDPLDNYMTALDPTETSGGTAARADYDGAGNTAKIMQMQPSTDYAAGYCNAFTFPDGKTRGYLPAFGQLYLAYQNQSAITTALNKCGGTAMKTDDYYHSSTFSNLHGNNRGCWAIRLSDGKHATAMNGFYLDNSLYVRPFADY